jgi:hypothetical protein
VVNLMTKMLTRFGSFGLLLIALLFLSANAVAGHGLTATLSPTVQTSVGTAAATPFAISTAPTVAPQAVIPLLAQEVTLASLSIRNIQLISPISSVQIPFRVPDNWQIDGTTYLSLNAQFFRNGISIQSSTSIQISIDGVLVSVFALSQQGNGNQIIKVVLPNDVLTNLAQRTHTLQILLDAHDDCVANQEIRVFIRTDMSFLHYEYREATPVHDLAQYPRPFFNNPVAGQVESAVIVLPAKYTMTDLQAATSLTAGLGLLTGNNLQIRTVTADTLSDLDQKTGNLLLIGKTGDNAVLGALYRANLFPTQLDASGSLTIHGQPIADTDGVLQIIANPQNAMRSILALTSKTPDGLRKAALALAGPTPAIGLSGSLALVSDVRVSPPHTPPSSQVTLASLGYSDVSVSGVGTHATEIRFVQPAGTVITNGAYLDLEFDFSEILRNAQTTLSIALNDKPIDSISLGTAPDPNIPLLPSATPLLHSNHLRAAIPPLSVRSGENNVLTIILDVQGNWKCYPPSPSVTWLSVRSTSLINLPRQEIDLSGTQFQVSDFPVPFSGTRNLQDTLVVLPDVPSITEIDQMMRLMARLGSETPNGSVFQPRISMGKLPDGINLSDYHLIVIGLPSTNSFLTQLANNLPQPFVTGSNDLQHLVDNAIYRLPPKFNIGVLQAFKSPWSPSHNVLVITGTSATGQDLAMNVLISGQYARSDLQGNVVYAVANAVAPINTFNPSDAGVLSTDIPNLETQSAQTGTPSTPQFSNTVTLGATITPLPTRTTTPMLSPTPLYTETPMATVMTAIPTFVPLPPSALAPEATKQPIWVIGLVILTVVVIVATILFTVISFIRRRNQDETKP